MSKSVATSFSDTIPVRGIQPGQIAASHESTILHTRTANVAKALITDLSPLYPGLIWKKGFSQDEYLRLMDPGGTSGLSPRDIKGIFPDGGFFLYDCPKRGLLGLLSLEAKDQQNAGNAIERWDCNANAITEAFPGICYMTFCTGEGAYPRGQIMKALNLKLLYPKNKFQGVSRKFNTAYPEGLSFFAKPQSFLFDEIYTPARMVLEARLKIISCPSFSETD